jgi:hypothetical protein
VRSTCEQDKWAFCLEFPRCAYESGAPVRNPIAPKI